MLNEDKKKQLYYEGANRLAEGDRLLAEAREKYRIGYILISEGKKYEEVEVNAE